MRSLYAKDYQDVPRPLAALPREYEAGHVGVRHAHRRAQLLYAIAGTMLVFTDTGSWIVPPRRALWIPAGSMHEVHCRGRVSLRTIYVEPEACAGFGDTCRAVTVSGLLNELIVEASSLPIEYDVSGRDGRVMALLMDEVQRMQVLPLQVPMPRTPALVAICQRIMRDPSQDAMLDDWVKGSGMARRTFTRRFREETAVSFVQWRQQVRLLDAMARLNEGQPVTMVALDVGYESPSAFTAAFRKAFNALPSKIQALNRPHGWRPVAPVQEDGGRLHGGA
jgi:AraC-like DNA-binding protein